MTIKELKKKAWKKDFDINLSNGTFKTHKTVYYDPEENNFQVFHSISGEMEILTEKEMEKAFYIN